MSLSDLGGLPSASTSTSSLISAVSSQSSFTQQTLSDQTQSSTSNSNQPWGWAVSLSTALVHPAIFPLVSFTSTAELVHFCILLSSNSTNMPPSLRMSHKSAVKTVVARHDELRKEKDHRAATAVALDPDCPICQLPVGKKSPEGVKEGYAVMPCGHIFGGVCIKTYLAITDKPQCPICRTDLFYRCSHPVLPAPYEHHKKASRRQSQNSPSKAAAKAFPGGVECGNCKYCEDRMRALMKRRSRRQRLADAQSASGASSTGSSTAASGTTAEGSGGDAGSSEDGRVGAKAKRTLKTSLPRHHEDDSGSELSSPTSSASSSGSEEEDDDDEDDERPDDTPVSPPQSAISSGLPPVPGQYGHWDLATKQRDWKFLSWYNEQEPKIDIADEYYA